jgi:hypothetical protein
MNSLIFGISLDLFPGRANTLLKPFNNPKSETDEKDNRAAKDWVRLFLPRNPAADLRSIRICAELRLRYDYDNFLFEYVLSRIAGYGHRRNQVDHTRRRDQWKLPDPIRRRPAHHPDAGCELLLA